MAGTVTLAGRVDRDELKAIYARSDLFVAPAFLESFGIAALEARCAGLPVLAMRGTGITEFVADRRRACSPTGPRRWPMPWWRSPGMPTAQGDRRAQPDHSAADGLADRAGSGERRVRQGLVDQRRTLAADRPPRERGGTTAVDRNRGRFLLIVSRRAPLPRVPLIRCR